jgi:hypothetical protein
MAKFERNEKGEYVCPACEREYDKYNSLFKHYALKHGNSVGNSIGNGKIAEKVDRAKKSITNKTKEIPETVTKLTAPEEIMGSDSNNDVADDSNKSSTVAPRKTKRVRLKPVEPPVKEPDENEDEEETETETWIIPGLIKGSGGHKQKASEIDNERKYYLIKGLI